MPTPSIRETLEAYVAGRVKAERVVEAVAGAYYGEQGARGREQWRPIVAVIERAHPGVVELSSAGEKPGFAVRLAERPFPKQFEAPLRDAIMLALASSPGSAAPGSPLPAPGLFARLYSAVRRLFTASA